MDLQRIGLVYHRAARDCFARNTNRQTIAYQIQLRQAKRSADDP